MTSGHHPTLSFLIQQRVSGWWGPHGVGKHAVWSSSMLSTLHMLFLVSSTQIAACLFVNGTGHLSRLRIALRPKISIANIVAAQHYGTSTSIYATSTPLGQFASDHPHGSPGSMERTVEGLGLCGPDIKAAGGQ